MVEVITCHQTAPMSRHKEGQVLPQTEAHSLSSNHCRLRDIFIAERRGNDRVQGPKDHQAAIVMGNSERAWTDFYDRHYQKRECKAGIQAMSAWRSSILTNCCSQPAAVQQAASVEDNDLLDVSQVARARPSGDGGAIIELE